MTVAVYTCVTGTFDSIKAPSITSPGVEFYCFTDHPERLRPPWKPRQVEFHRDNRRTARMHKLLPHKYMPDADAWVWVDGSMHLQGDVRTAVTKYLAQKDIAVRIHPWRKPLCAYSEARACIEIGKDDPDLIKTQMDRYRAEGYPERHGMVDSAFLLRRNTAECRRFNEAWWAELDGGSLRDQLSFNYTSWKTGIGFQLMSNAGHRTDQWVHFYGHGTHHRV